MKYIKGGSISQPNTNNTLSDNPTIIKSIYSSLKNLLNYIKSKPIILVILSTLILFVYIFIWVFREPLTQEDIQVEIAKVTCDNGWSQDKCPNKYLAPDIECINNECDENTCCVNQINCSEWDGICPNEFDIDNTKLCSPDIEYECSEKCCVKTCVNFLNADCPTDFTKIATNFCSIPEGSTEYECNYMDCCAEQVTCAMSFNSEECPSNQIFISSPASVLCDNNNCTALDCCVPAPDSESDTNPPTTQPTPPTTTPPTTPPTTTPPTTPPTTTPPTTPPTTTPPTPTTTTPPTPLTSPSSNVDSVSEEQSDIGETDGGE